MRFNVIGNLVNIHQRKIYAAEVVVEKGKILSVTAMPELKPSNYILPGFIDAHIHIESSMLIPSEFARLATDYNTVRVKREFGAGHHSHGIRIHDLMNSVPVPKAVSSLEF